MALLINFLAAFIITFLMGVEGIPIILLFVARYNSQPIVAKESTPDSLYSATSADLVKGK